MTLSIYADGRQIQNSSTTDALDDLRNEYPDMVTHSDGHRVLVWADEASAENDAGQHAVAYLIIVP